MIALQNDQKPRLNNESSQNQFCFNPVMSDGKWPGYDLANKWFPSTQIVSHSSWLFMIVYVYESDYTVIPHHVMG